MYQRDVRETAAFERGTDSVEVGQFIFRTANSLGSDAVPLKDFQNAFAVRAVDDDQPLAVRRRDGREHRLNRKRAAALHQYRLPAIGL